MTSSNGPLYETNAAGTKLLRIYLLASCVVVLGCVIVGMVAAQNKLVLWWLIALCSLTPVGLVWLIVPERFEVYSNRLRLLFPLFKWDLRFETIESVSPARWWQSYAFRGLRFATSPGGSIVILRRSPRLLGRPNIVISPGSRDEFLEVLSRAMQGDEPSSDGNPTSSDLRRL